MRPSRSLGLLALTASLLAGCGTSGAARELLGVPPSPAPRPAGEEVRWVLIQNPRFGATMAEPEYIWVEEDRIPGGVTTFLFGRKAVLAPLHEVPRHGPPPGDGPISPLQGGPPVASRSEASAISAGPRGLLRSERPVPGPASPTVTPAPSSPQEARSTGGRVQEPAPRGYIIHVQAGLVVVDLTAVDGIRKGSLLTLYRERVPLTHPVSGQYLGEVGGEEIGTARVVEVRERFSVAELQRTRPGPEPKVRDRVVITQP